MHVHMGGGGLFNMVHRIPILTSTQTTNQMVALQYVEFLPANEFWGTVMFLLASVILFTGGRGSL